MTTSTTRPDAVDPTSGPSGDSQPGLGRALPLPHERDEAAKEVAAPLDPVIVQARKDLDAGLVDTDLRNAPGADAQQREHLLNEAVPGAGSGAKAGAGSQAAKPHRPT